MVIARLESFVNSVAINIFPFKEIYVKPTSIFYYRVDNDGKTACFFKYKAKPGLEGTNSTSLVLLLGGNMNNWLSVTVN